MSENCSLSLSLSRIKEKIFFSIIVIRMQYTVASAHDMEHNDVITCIPIFINKRDIWFQVDQPLALQD